MTQADCTVTEPFEVDLWEVVPCETCGAEAGHPCRTLKSGRIKWTSHACRRVWIGLTSD